MGFCVARSTISGNAKASECGTSNGLTPTLFYAAKPCTNNNNRLFGSQGHKCQILKCTMSVIFKVDEKVRNVIDALPKEYSNDMFLEAFKNTYPKDYQKCWRVYRKEERMSKGKPHPMQHPDKYIINALKSYLSRNNKTRLE